MSLNQRESSLENIGQSPGCDPKSAKRNSGLFAFLKWFKPSASRESIDADLPNSHSSSCDSLNSAHSAGTVASFSYVPASAYPQRLVEKSIVPGPETDTYKARLKQRDKRRENDKNVTLRKKYNLFFNRETLLKAPPSKPDDDEENTRSLPLMTRTAMDQPEQKKVHRRTNSESSKMKKAGAYLHVKGKRKAPQPPVKILDGNSSTMSLRRKKRLAPSPPVTLATGKLITTLTQIDGKSSIQYADADIIFNDSLKLDHGILRAVKEGDVVKNLAEPNSTCLAANTSSRSSYVEAPVSPRPWYKRNMQRDVSGGAKKDAPKIDHKYEPVEKVPEGRNSTICDLTNDEAKRKDDKRKSGMSFLTNISELDREASEIVRMEHQKGGGGEVFTAMPPFMRPKEEPSKANTDSWASPKRRSARDLIAKFNAITSVTKVTVNSAFFGPKEHKRDYFGGGGGGGGNKKQESLLEAHKKRIEQFDKKARLETFINPIVKSESASAIKSKPPGTPKLEKKSWNCPKCSIDNDYWRIICHVCSTIKPYFDDFTLSTTKTKDAKTTYLDDPPIAKDGDDKLALERSKTQIGFAALANYNHTKNKKLDKSGAIEENAEIVNKKEEREKLKKMLIEMKNSLPKRKSNILMKQNSRASVIVENAENGENESPEKPSEQTESAKDEMNEATAANLRGQKSTKNVADEKSQEEKVTEILIGTKTTVYENIKVKSSHQDHQKVSASAQTKPVVKMSNNPISTSSKNLPNKTNNFELMRPKDFENIYSDNSARSPARIYANLAQSDELSLFFNVPKKLSDIKNNINHTNALKHNNTDTIEINRLLRRLESSIAKGELVDAAIYAKELAQLKINCSVIRQKAQCVKKQGYNIEMYVEDKLSHRGPFNIEVTEKQTVAELKRQVQQEFEIPCNVQRWILGKELATDDNATLKDHNICKDGCPVFLYLVAPDNKENSDLKTNVNKIAKPEDLPSTSKSDELPFNSAIEIPSTSKSQSILKSPDVSVDEHQPEKLKLEDVEKENHMPKIVKVIPKVFEPPPNAEIVQCARKQKTTKEEVSANSSNPILECVKSEIRKAEEDLMEDYESNTLKPEPKEWACHLCTLLNPLSSNICAVCATIRHKDVVVPMKRAQKKKAPQPAKDGQSNDATYIQLVHLDNADLVENKEPFECVVCFLDVPAGRGVTLRECLHQFCKQCLAQTIEYTEDAEIKCPYRDDQYSCNIALQDREIKALVTPIVYDQYLAKSVTQAENAIGKSFHCKTPDCKGWCIFEDNVNEFRCPVCRKMNCLTCQAIHSGMNCKQYQEKMNQESEVDEDAKRTKEMLEEMVSKGEALTCPTCQVILMKKWGCDWLRCSMCKTEICWVTRGPRWGPGGKGDTSGGCQCGLNGVKCHPQCNYCH